jgi:hypothetical protein
MILLPFLPILMVAQLGRVSGEETLPIPMLADFGRTILRPVKAFCQKPREDGIQREEVNRIICESVKALDNQFKDFGAKIMQHMNSAKLRGNEEGHSVSQFIL